MQRMLSLARVFNESTGRTRVASKQNKIRASSMVMKQKCKTSQASSNELLASGDWYCQQASGAITKIDFTTAKHVEVFVATWLLRQNQTWRCATRKIVEFLFFNRKLHRWSNSHFNMRQCGQNMQDGSVCSK